MTFVVHGLSGEELLKMKTKELKSAALSHLMSDSYVLGISQASVSESIYNNPQLYPKQVKPETKEEKECFQIIKDLDHVGGQVQGSLTSKKYMRK